MMMRLHLINTICGNKVEKKVTEMRQKLIMRQTLG